MSAPSPVQPENISASFTIKIDGKGIDEAIQIVAIDTVSEINAIPRACVTLVDGSPAEQNFEISSLSTFIPGKMIEIYAGYNEEEQRIFSGLIVKQGIEVTAGQESRLLIEATDPALKMTLERRNAVFENFKDSDLIEKLIRDNGLSTSVQATKVIYENLVQYYATDWDMMMTRAQVNGMVAWVEAGKVTVASPDSQQAPVLALTYGDSILGFKADMDAATQLRSSAIKSHAWDSSTQKLVESGPGPISVTEPGNISSAELAEVFNLKTWEQQTAADVDKNSLQQWSSAELLKSRLSKIRGSVSFQGSSLAKLGSTIELAGLGDRFNGRVYISAVRHSISNGQWHTSVRFGLSPDWYTEVKQNIEAPGASGLLPSVQGLQVGTVKKVGKDPAGEFRVQLILPLLQANKAPVWARLSTLYAGVRVGAVFYPEVGDEVVVGFMNDDPSDAIILGSLYSKKHPPAYTPNEKNDIKAFVTRSKMKLYFDDKDKIITLETPGKHRITLDDKSGTVSISDSNKNSIDLSKRGITLSSAKDLKISARGNISLEAGRNLSARATANASVEGLNITQNAGAKFSASGKGNVELKSPGVVTINGSVVKID